MARRKVTEVYEVKGYRGNVCDQMRREFKDAVSWISSESGSPYVFDFILSEGLMMKATQEFHHPKNIMHSDGVATVYFAENRTAKKDVGEVRRTLVDKFGFSLKK